jgi:hypothetical protein
LIGDIATASRAARGLSRACSFSGDTEVLMADGTTKPISEIKEGDQVIAADPETGEKGPRTVTAVMVHDDTVLELATQDGGSITTTEDHPYYNVTDKQWERADRLDPGDSLYTSNGTIVRVGGLRLETRRLDVAYNLTVADTHTFFVLNRNTPVLVHNSCLDGINVYSDDFGATWAKVEGAPNDLARVERAGGELKVTDVFRRSQDEIRGADLVAAALQHEGVRSGEIVTITGIENPLTLAAHQQGQAASSSVLGRTGISALGKLGLSASSVDWYVNRGKLNIVIQVR